MSLEINKTEILSKLKSVENELKTTKNEALKKSDFQNVEKTDENDLVDLSSISEDDEEGLEKALDVVSKILDLDGNGKLSNKELKEFEEILDNSGISMNSLLTLYEENGGKLEDSVNEIDTKKIKGKNLEEFKEIVADYPRLKELIEEVGYKEIFNSIDENNNGKIEADEIKNIFNSKNITQEALSNFTEGKTSEIEEKLKKVLEQIQNDPPYANTTEIPDFSNYTLPEISYVPQASYSAPSSGVSYSAPVNNSTVQTAKTGDSIETLEKQKTEKTGELSKLNSELEKAYNGNFEDGEIKSKKEDLDKKEEEYKTLLANEAKENKEVQALKENLDLKEEEIKENEENIKDANLELNDVQNELSEKNLALSSLQNEKGALESALSALNGVEITDSNKEEIESKKSELEGQIQAKEKEIKALEDEIKVLEDKEKALQDKIEEYEDLKVTLNEDKNKIEENIKDKVSDVTKNALEAYNDAKKEFEGAKEDKIKSIKENIQTTQASIKEIEEKIQVLEAEKIKKENQISPWGQYDAQRGQALADAANSLYGGVSKGSGYCATGVSQAINKAFGYATHGNGCDYGNVLSQRDDWVEITDTISSAQDLKNLPAGAVVSWSPYNTNSLGRIYGHVYIADGQGHEISDFKSNITTYYADRGSQYRVFLPKSVQ